MPFIHDLFEKARNQSPDSRQQAGDAVLVAFPFLEVDTFDFKARTSKPMGVKEGEVTADAGTDIDALMKVGRPIVLDNLLSNLAVTHTKNSFRGSLNALLLDPNSNLLSAINPGDWIVCWMFDNKVNGDELREKIAKGNLKGLNGFDSGLKFVGKVFSMRMQKGISPEGFFSKRISLNAVSFSELGTAIYYDPLLSQPVNKVQFISNVNDAVNARFSGDLSDVNQMTSTLLMAFLGNPPNANGMSKNYNAPLRVPTEVSKLLGVNNGKAFIDILQTHIGAQKFSTNYTPDGLVASSPNYPTVYFTPNKLLGFIWPLISPFTNTPIWSAVQQHSVPLINEMFTCLRANDKGDILPHVIIRQIPFNTDDFVNSGDIVATAFRELPRWKIDDRLITSYDTGKSGAMRANYIQVQPTDGLSNGSAFNAFIRASIDPRFDDVDIQRHGLAPFVSQIAATEVASSLVVGPAWRDMVTDRMIGSHLKLSGTMATVGMQEPIAVGDNLEYDGMLYHIETVTHTLNVNPMSGIKSFNTQLALSSGVPASGPVLPEIAIRTVTTLLTGENQDGPTFSTTVTGTQTIKHKDSPQANLQSDEDN